MSASPSLAARDLADYDAMVARLRAEGYTVNDMRGFVRAVIQQYSWTYFATLTFEKQPGFEWAERQWARFLRIGGWKDSDYVRVTEYQRRGVLHYHALLARSIWKGAERVAGAWWHFNVAPLCRVEVVESPKVAALNYVTKYLSKDPEVENSIIFGGKLKRGLRLGLRES